MTSNHRAPMIFAVILAASLMLAAGCSDDENPVEVNNQPPIEPRTPSELVFNFLTTYEARDSEKYMALLDPGFLFLLQSETTLRMPSVGDKLDYDEEGRIHRRMFSGEAVIDPQGEHRPGVQDIGFPVFQAQTGWAATDNETLFPDAVWALFEVAIIFDRGQTHSTFQVNGLTKIYARAYTHMVNGEEHTYFRLAGMVDLTESNKGVEATPWGLIKAFFS